MKMIPTRAAYPPCTAIVTDAGGTIEVDSREGLRRGTVSADLRTLNEAGGREADSFYRDRWSYDKVVRSTRSGRHDR